MLSFFDLQMDSPLFILMACNSATQQISTGDEPLGLVTSLLCAGASSVIGTLWPVESESARTFAAEFLKRLVAESQRQNQGADNTHWIDLAGALQATCIELMNDYDTRLPEYWAPFVLHGCHFSKNLGLS
jgi:CHAT domain-containing protein